jgi:hypothetical protein
MSVDPTVQNDWVNNLLLKATFTNLNNITKIMVEDLLKGLFRPDKQMSTNLCWACSSSMSIRTSILNQYGINVPSEYIFKLLFIGKFKMIMTQESFSQIREDDFLGHISDITQILDNIPIIINNTIHNNLISVKTLTILSEIQIIRLKLYDGIQPIGIIRPPAYSGDYAMLLVGMSLNDGMKFFDSNNINGNLRLMTPELMTSSQSQILEFNIGLEPLDQNRLSLLALRLGSSKEETSSDDSSKNIGLSEDVLDQDVIKIVLNFIEQLTNQIVNIFIRGHWRYRRGMKPHYLIDDMLIIKG